ncbi:unnamed protein product [Candidula unifasciata]|uniref:RCC1-like domain-containing protein n=1 Tax=Candidula unifasciata TaxID=100452 RepID=A0A8S3YGA1_9EUPU|nr:unnamed protein product [Candidula unifasciata]
MAERTRPGRGLHESPIDRPFLWAWGANNCGQLGYGCVCEKQIPSDQPVPFTLESDWLKSAGGGGGFSYVVTESGQVFTCGNNTRGQLGHGDFNTLPVFSKCQFLSQTKIVKVAAGWDFMLAISDAGTLLSWGSNMFGQLGRDVPGGAGCDAAPAHVGSSYLGRQVDISAGLRHGLSLSECGKVYSWGHGKRGQLGLDVSDKTTQVRSDHPLTVPVSCTEKPIQVFAGMFHSGLLTEAGSVLMWGCNKYGQCGQDPDITQTVPAASKVAFPTEGDKSSRHIVSVTSGWTHVISHTDSSILYSWGRADLGQLGRICQKSCDHIPGVVIGLSGVTSHSCGSEHTLVLTEDGQVYSWGWNEHSICGTDHEENILEPLRVSMFVDKRIIAVGCGAGHSFCIGAGGSCEGAG